MWAYLQYPVALGQPPFLLNGVRILRTQLVVVYSSPDARWSSWLNPYGNGRRSGYSLGGVHCGLKFLSEVAKTTTSLFIIIQLQ